MKTEIYKITGTPEDEFAINLAGEIIRNGGLVGIPTETVYGLGASALSQEASKKIYAAKGRPSDNPLIVHIWRPEEADKYAVTSELYYRIADRFMPGPITVIMPKRECIPYNVTGGLDTVAIRCPENTIARKIIYAAGEPIAAPSANRSGSPSPTSAKHVIFDMDGRIEMIVDGGQCKIGVESTVVSINNNACRILRPGAVTAEMLREVCDKVEIDDAVVDPSCAGEHPSSPGMKYKHYSPKAEVLLVDGDRDRFYKYIETNASSEDGVFVTDDDKYVGRAVPLVAGKHGAADELNRSLFSLFRLADELSLRRIFVQVPPKTDEYLALYNRLIRAAAGKVIKI